MHISGYQENVEGWLLQCFGKEIATDSQERAFRFIEEALELAQAIGVTENEATQVLKYVYRRPTGEREQEIGGVMVTLAALCYAIDVDFEAVSVKELMRVKEKIEKIRAKHFSKPENIRSPLTGKSEPEPEPKIHEKTLCEIHGHNMFSVYTLHNHQSSFGQHKCSRCGYAEDWQYDFVNGNPMHKS